jgi:hypothetical protein
MLLGRLLLAEIMDSAAWPMQSVSCSTRWWSWRAITISGMSPISDPSGGLATPMGTS